MSLNNAAEDYSADEPWLEENTPGNAVPNPNLVPRPVRNHSV